VLQQKVLIRKRFTINAHAARSITLISDSKKISTHRQIPMTTTTDLQEVTTLDHKVLDNSVKHGSLIPDWNSRFSAGPPPVSTMHFTTENIKLILYLNSPVQNCLLTKKYKQDQIDRKKRGNRETPHRKFSAARGQMSANNSILTRPTAVPPIVTSKNTTGFDGFEC
jgi:hypothetical protein